jgi:hypothetical protein
VKLLLLLLLLHWSCMELQHKGGVTREESAAASTLQLQTLQSHI